MNPERALLTGLQQLAASETASLSDKQLIAEFASARVLADVANVTIRHARRLRAWAGITKGAKQLRGPGQKSRTAMIAFVATRNHKRLKGRIRREGITVYMPRSTVTFSKKSKGVIGFDTGIDGDDSNLRTFLDAWTTSNQLEEGGADAFFAAVYVSWGAPEPAQVHDIAGAINIEIGGATDYERGESPFFPKSQRGA